MEENRRRVAVVTGGGSGLGRAIVRVLKRNNFNVATFGRRPERLVELQRAGIETYVCDVAHASDVAATIKCIVRDLGPIDVLVNNAGVVRDGSIGDISAEAIRYQFDINVIGLINCTQAYVSSFSQSRGCIINISSALAKRPLINTSIYAATKGAVESFTRAMALELGPKGIRVNAIAPGLVRSEIYLSDGVTSEQLDKMLREFGLKYVLGRSGKPDDVAELAAFLVSDKAEWITGAIVPVDSGYANIGFRQDC